MISFTFYLAAICSIVLASFLLPVLLAFGFGETEVAFRLVNHLSLGLFFFVGILLAIRGRVEGMDRIIVIYVSVAAWFLLPLITAIPLADILGIAWTDAIFLSFSGFTTTGAEVLPNLDNVPKSILFLRAQLQWLGGLATLLTFMLVLAPSKIGGLPAANKTSMTAAVLSSSQALLRFCVEISQLFLFVTIICFAALMISGVNAFDASILTMSAVSSGGFLPGDEALEFYAGSEGMLVMAIFLIISATSVFWHRMIIKGRMSELMEHRESYLIIAVFVLFGALFSGVIIEASGASTALAQSRSTAEGFFNAASLISTSGMQSRPGIFALLPPAFVLAVVLVGAGCFSTASGLKFYRIGAMLNQALNEINQLIFPHGIRPRHFGSMRYDMQMMKAIWALFILTLMAIILGASVLSLFGMSFQSSITASIAAVTNAGPLYNMEWTTPGNAEWPAFHDMEGMQKITLALLMVLGRLEFIVVFSALNVFFWIKR